MRILLTNDDGIRAPGLAAVCRRLAARHDVCVVAPETVQSASGHGITLQTPLLTQRVRVEGIEGIAVDGRPADCVKVALAALVRPRPELVVSGINAGANVGINVIYSGTIAAAIEAAFLGVPAVALSLHLDKEADNDFDRAAAWSEPVIDRIVAAGLGAGQVVSVNLPALRSGEEPAGVKVVRQCTHPWTDEYERRTDPRGNDYFWNSSVFTLGSTDDDTDVAAIKRKFITVTPLQFDLTDRDMLTTLEAHMG